MPARCVRSRGAFLEKYLLAGRCPEHIDKPIPAGLWRRFAWLALWCVQHFTHGLEMKRNHLLRETQFKVCKPQEWAAAAIAPFFCRPPDAVTACCRLARFNLLNRSIGRSLLRLLYSSELGAHSC
jgi:hypothetical protein